MGQNIATTDPYKIYSTAGLLPNLVVSDFKILSYPAGLNIKLDSITKSKTLLM